jgi:ribosomal-protein-alanine N-acetyltransferase
MTSDALLPALECVRPTPTLAGALGDFFEALERAGDEGRFHPHPLTREEAGRVAAYAGRDLYYVLAKGDHSVVGYGMLRGWDAGFDVPSLGIAIHPAARGQGLGKTLMLFLHAAARLRGATRIRLKVYPDNAGAVDLYRKLGYVFAEEQDGQLVGVLEL